MKYGSISYTCQYGVRAIFSSSLRSSHTLTYLHAVHGVRVYRSSDRYLIWIKCRIEDGRGRTVEVYAFDRICVNIS